MQKTRMHCTSRKLFCVATCPLVCLIAACIATPGCAHIKQATSDPIVAVKATPKIDGKLDEPCWTDRRAITFVRYWSEKQLTEDTRAWIAYDDSALYAAFHCPYPKGATLLAKATEHDGRIWKDDSIEIYLDVNHDHETSFHLAVNCMAVIMDLEGKDLSWESGARAAATRGEDHWAVEVAIPYDNLRITPYTGSVWGMNLGRNDRINAETCTASPGTYGNVDRFRHLRLEPNLWRFARKWSRDRLTELESDITTEQERIGAAPIPDHVKKQQRKFLQKAKQCIIDTRRFTGTEKSRAAAIQDKVKHGIDETVRLLHQAHSGRTMFGTKADARGGFSVAIANPLQKVRRSGPFEGVLASQVKLRAARDETESFQLVVMPAGQKMENVTVVAPPLQGTEGIVLMEWRIVEYVKLPKPSYPTEHVGWWPDPLMPAEPFDVAVDRRQPLWFTVTVPPDAHPGLYRGKITIKHGTHSLTVPVELRVWDFSIPRPGTLATPFGLYKGALAEAYFGRDGHDRLTVADFTRWCEFMGRYRLGPKNAPNEYVSRKKDGNVWKVDLSKTRKVVAGLARKYYSDYSLGVYRLPSAPAFKKPDFNVDTSLWVEHAKAKIEEWNRLALPKEVFIYGVDEPDKEDYPTLAAIYKAMHEAVPETPIMQTVCSQPAAESLASLVGLVDIWCPISSLAESEFYTNRRKAGDTLWTYVCCYPEPPYANFFIDRPAIEHRVLFWQTRKLRATGLLYWCVFYWKGANMPGTSRKPWPEHPLEMQNHFAYAELGKKNGDGILIYPGPDLTPIPSLRLEVIRDGIEDYEYLALLSKLVEQAEQRPTAKQPGPELMKKARELCEVPEIISRSMREYTQDPQHIFSRRREIGDIIEQLVRAGR